MSSNDPSTPAGGRFGVCRLFQKGDNMIRDEHLYLAGPVCFYPRGYSMWYKYRSEAEFHGAVVELPNDNWASVPGDTLAERIINNCDISTRTCTACLANIENHRGLMPDAGTVFELGMAYGLDLKCYAYKRDKRPMSQKYLGPSYTEEEILDREGEMLDRELPFGDCLTSACKIVEGNFTDCLRTFMEDIDEESKKKAVRGYSLKKAPHESNRPAGGRPLVYVGDCHRTADCSRRHSRMREILEANGFEAVFPEDRCEGIPCRQGSDDPYERAYDRFDNYQQHVRDCDIYLAVLEDHRGYEVDSDVAFESGMAYMFTDKKMYGWMEDGRGMAERTSSVIAEDGPKDINGWSTEEDPFPVNMMYGRTPIFNGMDFESAVKKMELEYAK